MVALGPRDCRGLESSAGLRAGALCPHSRQRAASRAAPLIANTQCCLTRRTPLLSHKTVGKDLLLASAFHCACDLTKSLCCVGLSFPNQKMGWLDLITLKAASNLTF